MRAGTRLLIEACKHRNPKTPLRLPNEYLESIAGEIGSAAGDSYVSWTLIHLGDGKVKAVPDFIMIHGVKIYPKQRHVTITFNGNSYTTYLKE